MLFSSHIFELHNVHFQLHSQNHIFKAELPRVALERAKCSMAKNYCGTFPFTQPKCIYTKNKNKETRWVFKTFAILSSHTNVLELSEN